MKNVVIWFFCLIVVVNFLFNILFIQKIDTIKTEVNNKIEKFEEESKLLLYESERLSLTSRKQEEQLSVLEEAISPADKRWVKIKKVRNAVVNLIKEEKLPKIMDINGLTSYAAAVVDYSEQYDVSIALILAITAQESAFNPNAISKAGAEGLMQLMPATAKECASDVNKNFYSIKKIQDNVQLGVWYLSKMMNIFNGDVELAIRAYNAGPVYVKKVLAGEVENFPKETINYHKRVMQYRERFLNLGF